MGYVKHRFLVLRVQQVQQNHFKVGLSFWWYLTNSWYDCPISRFTEKRQSESSYLSFRSSCLVVLSCLRFKAKSFSLASAQWKKFRWSRLYCHIHQKLPNKTIWILAPFFRRTLSLAAWSSIKGEEGKNQFSNLVHKKETGPGEGPKMRGGAWKGFLLHTFILF